MKRNTCLIRLCTLCITIAFALHRHHKNSSKRIVGGTYVSITSRPYQVVLDYWNSTKYQFICGGSLISTKHVLTAGHCVAGFQKNNYLVKVGFDGLWNILPNQISYVDEIYLHEQYYILYGAPINDIAVMRLSQSFTLNSNVQTIRLPFSGSPPSNSLCTITGFGKTKMSDSDPSPYLMGADLWVITNNECRAAISALLPNVDVPLMDTNICTMDQPTRGSCSGDSGGPLAQNRTLIGIISWGVSPCEIDRNPTVYTEVSKYINWINSRTIL